MKEFVDKKNPPTYRLETNTESNKKKKKRKLEALCPFQHEVDYLRFKINIFILREKKLKKREESKLGVKQA